MVIFLQVAFSEFVICNANFVNYRNICMYSSVILGDPGAISRVDKTSVVKVYCKIKRSPWALTLTEPVPEAFELPTSYRPQKNIFL